MKPHSDVLDAIFESEKMKALASFQDLYVGLEPYRNNELLGGGVLKTTAPAVFGLLAAIELHPTNKKAGGTLLMSLKFSALYFCQAFHGSTNFLVVVSHILGRFTSTSLIVFAPIGGFEAVSKSLENLAKEKGVQFEFGKMVTGVTERGVHMRNADGSTEFVEADLTIVNADLPYATKSLILPKGQEPDVEPKFDWDDSFSYSSGVISFHWSIDKTLDDLNTHNVFMVAGSHSQAEASWKILRSNQGDVDETTPFNFYVHRASKTDPTAAPNGCDSIMVLVPCRTLLRDAECANLPRDEAMKKYKEQFSTEVVSEAKQAVLKRLAAIESLQNLESHIVDEVVDTPATWAEQFHLAAGTPFALVRTVEYRSEALSEICFLLD